MSVRYRALALSDLDEIVRYLEPRSPTGTRSVLRAIYAAIEQIERYRTAPSKPRFRAFVSG